MKGKQKNSILLIDGNNLLFRCYYKFAGMVSKSGTPSSMVFGYPYTLRSAINKFNPYMVINVFDGGKDNNRLGIHQDYKKREPKLGFDIEDFKVQKEMVMKLLLSLNNHVVWERYKEADDFIYSLVRKYKKKYDIIIVSSDKDFNQLVEKGVTCFNPHKGISITHKNMKRHFGYDPYECVDWLILDGDSSDNIPGYKGLGPKTIRAFLDEHSSIKKYLKGGFSFKRINNELLATVYKRNRYLIDLAYFYRKFNRKTSIPFYGIPKFDRDKIWRISTNYDINTFLKTDFQKPFKKLKT